MKAYEISRTGLDVEWQRLQVIATNLANLNTSRTADGEPFRPMRLLSGPRTEFGTIMAGASQREKLQGVHVLGVETLAGNVRRVHEPGHPHADTEGFVTYPDLDHAGEMTLMIRAARSYEANLAAINLAHQMYARAMELGRNQ